MRVHLLLVVTLAAGLVTGALGATLLRGEPSFTETFLLKVDLAGLKNKELIVSRLETAPGWAHGRHYHAGHEIVYVLEGTGLLEVEGQPALSLTPGVASYVPPGQVHAGKNASRTAAFKFLLLRIHDKGQPLSVELQ